MAYRVISDFADLQDGKRMYRTGETFPRAGISVSPARLKELSGSDNGARRALIEEIPEQAAEKPAKKRVRKND